VRGDTEELIAHAADGPRSLRISALGGSVGTPPDGLTAGVLMVRTFEELRNRAEEARGKIIFFNRPMPRRLLNTFQAYGEAVPQRSNGAVEAAKVGAVAAIVRSMTTRLDDMPHTGALRYDEAAPRVPAAAISTQGAEELAATLSREPALRLQLRLSCKSLPDVESANVVGELPGDTAADEVVLIGAHLDAWDIGQGAHDDGAGCAQCLDAARLLRQTGARLDRTLRVVLFMNEENGLRGAHAYAERHRGALKSHVAAIESDRGGLEPRGFTTSLDEGRWPTIRNILRPLAAEGMGTLLPGGGGADISVLGPAGVPLFGLFASPQRYFDYHHSDLDRLEHVNERELQLGAAALAYFAGALARTSAYDSAR
jgi:hypothetical protein